MLLDAATPIASDFAGSGATPVYLALDDEVVAVLAIADSIKPTAAEAVAGLHRRGLRTVLLSGDDHRAAQAVGHALAVDEVIAEVIPADKAAVVQRLQEQGRVVAMVGDGINDAPALAQADVGIAMGGGADVAIESAQVTLMHDDPRGVGQAVTVGRGTLRTIHQNLVWAFGYNVLLIPIAAGLFYPIFQAVGPVPGGLEWLFGDRGFFEPIVAGFAMALSSLSVMANSLRLQRLSLGDQATPPSAPIACAPRAPPSDARPAPCRPRLGRDHLRPGSPLSPVPCSARRHQRRVHLRMLPQQHRPLGEGPENVVAVGARVERPRRRHTLKVSASERCSARSRPRPATRARSSCVIDACDQTAASATARNARVQRRRRHPVQGGADGHAQPDQLMPACRDPAPTARRTPHT